MELRVTRAGFLTTVQDIGRAGSRQFGVSTGGALDGHALRLANLLAGNDQSAAGLEITLGPVRLRFPDERIVAWGGGDYEVKVAARAVPAGHSARIGPSEELMISGPGRGCRGWLAISGAVDVPIVLGSRGTDLRANLGGLEGRALRDGDTLPLGNNSELSRVWLDHLRAERIASWSAPATWSSPHRAEPILQIIPGSDWDRFTDSSRRFLIAETFVVSSDSDRMGARLEGPALKTNEEKDLTSEAVVPGTIQVPPSGLPIILLGDCQTIGGYPKIAHVITVDLAIAAQLCPGSRVRFAEVSIMSAHELLLERETEFERFRLGLTLRGS